MTRTPEVLSFRLSSKRLPPWLAARIRQWLGRVCGFAELNQRYAKLPPCDSAAFSSLGLAALQVDVETQGPYPEVVPATGPLVIVANHPFGAIEGAALDALLCATRPDAKIMTVHWLAQFPEYRERFIFVSPPRARRRRRQSVAGWREAMSWLRGGHALAFFPGGNAARFRWSKCAVAELDWSPHVARAIMTTRARTIPVYFPGRNSWLFQAVSMICPPLLNFLLIRELLNKRGRPVTAIWGTVIEPGELDQFGSHDDVINHLKRRVEALGASASRQG